MKKITLILFLWLCTTITLSAQDNALLWKIEHETLSHPSYLYGTIHLICSEDMAEHPAVDWALESVEKVVFELDFSDLQLQQKMMQAQVNSGDHIKNYLDEDHAEVLDEYFKQHIGAGLSQIGNLKPFALTAMAMQSMIQCSEQLYSFEGALLMKARELSLSVAGLETPEFQFGLFDSIPVEDQIDELVKGIMEPDSVINMFESMVHQYREKNIESLYNTFTESPTGAYQKEILDDRNMAWIPKIEEMMENDPIFIAVGAMHLAGKNGVIELLRKQGYSVTPIRNDQP
jgi:uncharacterized protein YbaP (TraB family)